MGAWILCVGWFGFNVMSAQTVDAISGVVALNSLMAMVGGYVVYGLLKKTVGIALTDEEQYESADLVIHHIRANPPGQD